MVFWRSAQALLPLGLFACLSGIWGGASHRSALAASVCSAEPQIWAETLTHQLPLFANLELARLRASFRVILVGPPELESLSTDQLLRLQVLDPAAEQVFELYFTTLERRLVLGADPNVPYSETFEGRSTETLQLFYRAFIVRSAEPNEIWRLFSLQITGPGIPNRDISNGAIAQGIRAWQRQGCPQPEDIELAGPPQPPS